MSKRETQPSRSLVAIFLVLNTAGRLTRMTNFVKDKREERRTHEDKREATVKGSIGFWSPHRTYWAHIDALMDISKLAFPDAPSQLDSFSLNLIIPGCKTRHM